LRTQAKGGRRSGWNDVARIRNRLRETVDQPTR
jgi:hypothetical protein